MAAKRRLWRNWLFVFVALVGATGAGCVLLESKERELVFRPVREYARTPSDVGLKFDDLWLTVPRAEGEGQERVHAWWLPAAVRDAPTVLYLHGVRWSLGNNLFRIARLHELGFAVLAIDYRGFGKSDGELPSETQVHADARAAWDELTRREPRADARFIYGHSLGAAVALELAATADGATGVIADSCFTSLADVVAERFPLGFIMSQKFDALARVAQLRVPALFVHGTADQIIPPAMSERLFAAAPEPKRILLIEGASHSNYGGVGMESYRRTLAEFIAFARQTARHRVGA